MLGTLRTLITGASARAEDQVRDIYAIELIDQRIREAEASLKAAKGTLASLIQRHRAEERLANALNAKITDMTTRATEALESGRDDMAAEAAEAIAGMENERGIRTETLDRLDQKVTRLRHSIEAGQRRLVDLKQGAITARAVRKEQRLQSRLRSTVARQSSADEAEDLIARVMEKDDPFEQSEILHEIDANLSHDTLADRMAAQGFGPTTKTTGADVLARLKSKS